MDNRYYTPEIEEFYVGFEYERKEYPKLDSSNWVKHIFNSLNDIHGGYDGETELSEIYHSNIKVRVKYLDREDIESLGFKYNKEYQVFHKQKNEESGWGLELYKNKVVINNTGDCIFCGVIKNKSELKKLLKQLNIEYNDKN